MRKIGVVMVRIVLLLVGLVVLASVLTAALVLLAVWLLRALWAKLTGQPVNPWTFKVNRQAMWNRFYRSPGQDFGASAAPPRRHDADVTDVEPKAIKPPQT